MGEGVHVHACFGGEERGGGFGGRGWWCGVGIAVEVDACWRLDEDVDVEGVADWLGGEVELAGYVAVDDGGDERDRIAVLAEEGDSEE